VRATLAACLRHNTRQNNAQKEGMGSEQPFAKTVAIYDRLCRYRHNRSYAECRVMPSWRAPP